MNHSPDIIIVGAGLVGTSLATALAPYFKITIVEKHLPTSLTAEKKDDRPISLAYGSQKILQTLGIWPLLENSACPIKTVEVCEQGAFGGVHFRADEYDVPALGYVVPFCELQTALYQKAVEHENVSVLPIEEIIDLQNGDGESVITVRTMDGHQTLTAPLVVACDGTLSTVRNLLKFSTTRDNYDEIAEIFKLNLSMPHRNMAFERFTNQGTLAILPMPNLQKMQLVWTHHKKQVAKAEQVAQIFRGRLSGIVSIEKRAEFPLQTIIVKQPVRPGLVLLGNAAHTIYPLAAQGFNLGLRDAAALSEILVDAKAAQKNWGKLDVLQAYLNWREPDQKNIARLTKGLITTFGLQLPGIKPLRGFGMLAMSLVPLLKNRLAKRTMGTAGRLPKLMRGVELVE